MSGWVPGVSAAKDQTNTVKLVHLALAFGWSVSGLPCTKRTQTKDPTFFYESRVASSSIRWFGAPGYQAGRLQVQS